MKTPIKPGLIALVFTCLTAFAAAPVLAGDDHHYRGYGHGKHQGHYYHHRGHKHGNNYRRYNSDDDEKLIYGLLVGGLFGYVIGNAQQQSVPETYYSPSPTTAYPEYVSPTTTSCLQEREYQMKVIVGGREADAYGTACLQPDGSWRRGPAQVVNR